MTTIFIRGSNPIWTEFDLTGHLFDDNFYMFVLQNTIPYIPATVWHDPSGNVPWTQPIRFLANGTLPIDIFWDPSQVYRLEFRQGPTQSDPLIYEVDNYSPGSAGSTPIMEISLSTNNQITNPQFSLISFASPYAQTSITTKSFEVAPGWTLNLTGSGNATVSQVALNSTEANITNAPYALEIVLNGSWTGAYLAQRFNQNGMLWAGKYVSSSVTARIDGAPQAISAVIYDSMGTELQSVLDSTNIDGTFNEYIGQGLLPATTNTDTPPNAYIEYRLILPTSTTGIFLTSFQLIASDEPIEVQYEQDTIERQVDHTFHYYRNSLLREEKESVLTGWDFGLNPWQSYPVTTTNLATFGYTADQTIVVQQNYVATATGNNISTERASFTQNYGFNVTAVTANNQFAIIQYISPQTIRSGWGNVFSAMVKLAALRQNAGIPLNMKMRLIYRASLPPSLAQLEPISVWNSSQDPAFALGWTAIIPENDPVYNLANGANVLTFEKFQLPASTNDNMTLAIVLYTTSDMIETGTPDNIVFNKVSLVQNDFAIDAPSLTYDETLKRCQFYYETSFAPGTAPSTAGPQQVSFANAVYAPMNPFINGFNQLGCVANGFGLQYKTIKCIVPNITFFSGASTTVGNIQGFLNGSGGTNSGEIVLSSFFTDFGGNDINGFSYRGTTLSTMISTVPAVSAGSAGILYQYVANARLGQ